MHGCGLRRAPDVLFYNFVHVMLTKCIDNAEKCRQCAYEIKAGLGKPTYWTLNLTLKQVVRTFKSTYLGRYFAINHVGSKDHCMY